MLPLLEARGLRKYFRRGFAAALVRAVDGVDLDINEGEVLALVGESGSGKSTLGRLLLRLYKPDSGRIVFRGVDITDMPESRLRRMRRLMQLVPQDPYASFNPLLRLGEQVAEPLVVHGIAGPSEARRMVVEAFEEVGLVPGDEFYQRLPGQLSGGQLQRAAIVRAALLRPAFIVADEPTSSLDVSVRAGILRLFARLREEEGTAILFITHDIATARVIADRIAVMYLGKIVEVGDAAEVISKPLHPYTAALVSAVPRLARRRKILLKLRGETGDPANPPPGCRLNPRCPLATERCSREEPRLARVDGRLVACFHPLGREA